VQTYADGLPLQIPGVVGAGSSTSPSWITGELTVADFDGKFRSLVSGLDRPTTFELIGETANEVTSTGRLLRVTGLDR
jgi:hypothetical protein